MRATVTAWNEPMAGTSVTYLIQVLQRYNEHVSTHQRGYYARLTSLCQSSGTGKSRVMQEVARKIVCIPICLASPRTGMYAQSYPCGRICAEELNPTAYPPGDPIVVSYLEDNIYIEQEGFQKRVQAFYYALFTVTKRRLSEVVLETGTSSIRLCRMVVVNQTRL